MLAGQRPDRVDGGGWGVEPRRRFLELFRTDDYMKRRSNVRICQLLQEPRKGHVDPNAPDGVWWTEELPPQAGGPIRRPDPNCSADDPPPSVHAPSS